MSQEVISDFAQLGLGEALLSAIKAVGYEAPSPIQAASIPPLLNGNDLLGQAQTGTGKTAAFALPLLDRIDLKNRNPQLLILTPTRELALQVAEAIQSYARHMKDFHLLPVYGGQGMDVQLRNLKRGVHVVVGTPGRVMDHLRRGTLDLKSAKSIVLDEADEMLRMGFIDDVEWILEQAPEQRQIALFSATMPKQIQRIAHRYLKNPTEVRIESKTATVDTITQRFILVGGRSKMDALTRVLEVESFDAMIIFVRTKTATVELAEKLEARGHAAAALSGDMNQAQREQTVDKLKRGSLDILVATDVVARGLDVERISHVVNYDIPYDTESYVHRIGRTGRAGRKGEAILFVAPRERRMLQSIEKATRQSITPMNVPSCELIADTRISRFKESITEALATDDLAFFVDLIEQYADEHDASANEVAAALAYLVQKDRPLLQERCKDEEAPKPRQFDQERPARDRGERGERKPRRNDGPQRPPEAGMERFRLEVGRDHGVAPGNIVGAIANEAGIDSQHIGQIKLYDDYATVDLPEGMPNDLYQHLRKVRVCGRQTLMSRLDGSDAKGAKEKSERDAEPRKPKADSDRKKPKRDKKFDKPRGERKKAKKKA